MVGGPVGVEGGVDARGERRSKDTGRGKKARESGLETGGQDGLMGLGRG